MHVKLLAMMPVVVDFCMGRCKPLGPLLYTRCSSFTSRCYSSRSPWTGL